MSVHPRLRGEIQIGFDRFVEKCRFIPAYAGKSVSLTTVLPFLTAHPRLRGEITGAPLASSNTDGSSPLTRGNLDEGVKSAQFIRFIPAYAEKSIPVCFPIFPPAVYPRLRGEIHRNQRRLSSSIRFIPAYAGKSEFPRFTGLLNRVHPRLRGEIVSTLVLFLPCYGSSPLTRGNHSRKQNSSHSVRFIPAYAGKSKLDLVFCFVPTVHPRLRGEIHFLPRILDILSGSSPLTRGNLLVDRFVINDYRFIPAYAGKSP